MVSFTVHCVNCKVVVLLQYNIPGSFEKTSVPCSFIFIIGYKSTSTTISMLYHNSISENQTINRQTKNEIL